MTADRGYGEQGVEDAVRAAGVRHVVLPRKGRPNAARREIEQRRAFKKMVRWRTGCEGRISCAKRDFGLNRTRIDGTPRRPNLVRPRHLRPQPRQDRRAHRMTDRTARPDDRKRLRGNDPAESRTRQPRSHQRVLQVEVASKAKQSKQAGKAKAKEPQTGSHLDLLSALGGTRTPNLLIRRAVIVAGEAEGTSVLSSEHASVPQTVTLDSPDVPLICVAFSAPPAPMTSRMNDAANNLPAREVLEFDLGVRVYPPSANGRYWRVRWDERRRARDTTAATRTAAIAKAIDVVERLARNTPTDLARARGAELVAHYLDPARRPPRVAQWSVRHRDEQTRYCARYVLPVIGDVPCRELTRDDFQQIIDQAVTPLTTLR